jgi:hypothetical protein
MRVDQLLGEQRDQRAQRLIHQFTGAGAGVTAQQWVGHQPVALGSTSRIIQGATWSRHSVHGTQPPTHMQLMSNA